MSLRAVESHRCPRPNGEMSSAFREQLLPMSIAEKEHPRLGKVPGKLPELFACLVGSVDVLFRILERAVCEDDPMGFRLPRKT